MRKHNWSHDFIVLKVQFNQKKSGREGQKHDYMKEQLGEGLALL